MKMVALIFIDVYIRTTGLSVNITFVKFPVTISKKFKITLAKFSLICASTAVYQLFVKSIFLTTCYVVLKCEFQRRKA